MIIDTAQIEYIDVQRTYFEIETASRRSSLIIFDGEDDIKVIMNHMISKPYAVNMARNVFREQRDDYANLYISVDAIKVKQIVDYLGNNIFEHLDGNISGWLFFFDPTPFANWDHACKYLLVIDTDNYEVLEYDKGLDEKVQMEQIY